MTVEWHQGHYNAIAKDIRSEFPLRSEVPIGDQYGDLKELIHINMIKRAVLADVAMRLAARFKKADPEFNVFSWLDQCSPHVDAYPFSELWEESDAE
jgi:hypothetical protein